MTCPTELKSLIENEALRLRLAALAKRWLAHDAEGDDLVQDLWLRMLRGALPADVVGQEAWLVTVLRHLCVDAKRRGGRYRSILAQVGRDEASSVETQTPEQRAEQAQRVDQALRRLVRTMPAGDVASVLLHEVFDFGHAELARLSGCREAASRQRLHRLRQRLRREDLPDRGLDDDATLLLALCQRALAQYDPSGLVAVLRASRPQAMATASVDAAAWAPAAAVPAPLARLIQVGNLLVLQVHTHEGMVAFLLMAEAITEAA